LVAFGSAHQSFPLMVIGRGIFGIGAEWTYIVVPLIV
jgi:hypothetical protein